MEKRCKARRHSDQMICAACGLLWDVNDPEPPECKNALSTVEALKLCRDQFLHYANYHTLRGNFEKAAENGRFVNIANAALANAARGGD